MKKVLIYTDTHKQNDFENSVENTKSEANRLIELYHNFQPWQRITSLNDFEALCIDPIKAMDLCLTSNSGIDLKQTGGKLPAPQMVAKLLDIDRDNYINAVKGLKIEPGSCKPCGQKVLQTGKGVLSYTTFKTYQEYLTFDQGRFTIDEMQVSEKKETFQVFAETDKQIEVYNRWSLLCKVLNEAGEFGYLSVGYDEIAKLFKGRLLFSFQAGKLSIDMLSLLYEIQNLKK